MNKKKFYTKEFILVNFFLLDVSVATISHYTRSLFILKSVCSLILLLLIFYDIYIMKADVKNASPDDRNMNSPAGANYNPEGHFALLNSKRLNFLFGLLTAWFALTLTYSSNSEFGALKLLNFAVSTIPAVYAFYYLAKTFTRSRMKVFIISVGVLSLLSVVLVILIWPFHYLGSFNITLTNWSHVIYGRFIGSVFIALLLILISETDKKWILIISAGVLFSFLGLLLSGYRGGLAAAAVASILFILFQLIRRKLKLFNFTMLLAACILGLLIMILFVNYNSTLKERYGLLRDYNQLKFEGDESIQSHLYGYRIALDMFTDSPLQGEGFGSFKNHYNNRVADFIEYPHNIFLEFASEQGIFGIILFLMLLYLIFFYSFKQAPQLMFYFLFALLLAQFSKDIPSNVLLWLGLAFPAIPRISTLHHTHKFSHRKSS